MSALIAGAGGVLGERLARELEAGGGDDVLFYVDDPGEYGHAGAGIAAAAAAAESRASLRRVCLLAGDRPDARARVVEDALRYLAAQRGVPMSIVRAGPLAFRERVSASRLAARALSEVRRPVVLVTGAAGGIGRVLGRILSEKGIEHRGTDIVPGPDGLYPSFLRCDLGDPAGAPSLAEFCGPVTHVVHLASRVGNVKSLADSYAEQFELNVIGTLNLLKALPAAIRHVCFASTMTVYGNSAAGAVDESHPVAPNCVYALTKLAAERLLLEEGARTGVKIALLRYTGTYGPGSAVSGRAIPNMISRLLEGKAPEIYGEGTAKRDYIYVDDLCRATVAASLREAEGIFNVGTGVGVSATELAALLIRLTGRGTQAALSDRAVDAQSASSMVYDIGKMKRELGVVPEVGLEDGLLLTIRHLRAMKEAGAAA